MLCNSFVFIGFLPIVVVSFLLIGPHARHQPALMWLAFFTPSQLGALPDGSFDGFVTISSVQEMRPE